MKDLISVIIPIYNKEKDLVLAVESVLKQDYQNLEILLIDDGSTDHSLDLCRQYQERDDRIHVFSKPNGGLSDARNYGIVHSHGKYLTFLDADDMLADDCISYMYQLLTSGKYDIAMVGMKVVYSNSEPSFVESNRLYVYQPYEALKEMLYGEGYFVSACAKLYKKELFENVLFPVGQLFEDVNTTYRCIMKSRQIICSGSEKYAYMIRKNSITTSHFSLQQLDLITATKQMGNDVLDHYPDLKKAVLRRIVYAYLSTYCRMIEGEQRFSKEEKMIYQYIRKKRRKILLDKEAPKRDKIALFCLGFGCHFFRFSWNLYNKIRKEG